MPKLVLLDAMGLAYRAYYAFIRRPLLTSKGVNTSALYGFATMALKIRREERPDFWALAWDGPGPTHRHERYEKYKATRKPMPQDLFAQMPLIEELAQAIGLAVLEVPGAEADDVMATLAIRAEREGMEVAIVTSDKDMLQLVSERVQLLSPTGKGEEYRRVDRPAVVAQWGVGPEQIGDVLALMGDSVDNIPGVPGVGEKTATELIARFGSLDSLYARLGEVREGLRVKLAAHREGAYLSRELVAMRTDLAIPHDWESMRSGPIRREPLVELSRRYELVRLERIAIETGVAEAEAGPRATTRAPERRAGAAERGPAGGTLGPPADFESGPEPDPFAAWDEPAPAPPREASATSPLSVAAGEPSWVVAPPFPEPLGDDLENGVPEPDESAEGTPPGEPEPEPATGGAPFVPLLGRRQVQESLDLWVRDEAGPPAARPERMLEVRARAIHGLGLLPILAGDDPRTARLVGLGVVARDGRTCYLPLAHEGGGNVPLHELHASFGLALADPELPKVSLDLKRDLHALAGAGIELEGLGFDLHLGSFLLDPVRDHSLAGLVRDFLGAELPDPAPPRAAGGARARPGVDTLAVGAAAEWVERAGALLFPLAEALRAQLEAREQLALYERVERPLVAVLHEMERTGVLLDRTLLRELASRAGAEIARLEAEIYALAGEAFNLNSGPQLARILFEKLQLKTGRRTKTGFSTDQAVLEELARVHPLPAHLLEYRQLTKLKSTYLDALPDAADPRDGRVHTTYHQAVAATGRLSSASPNLQNIPMRTPQGREIRRAFVAPPGRILVGGDYSQIELRVMAHLSGDPQLIDAFRSGEDVHESTARRIFGVGAAELDPAMRARAKIVNFGVMYGMGARSLSGQMGISLKEAQEFIGHYFRVYARVREFLDSTLEQARRRGYVQTLLGRRRYLPGLASTHGGERSLAERVAINTPIQGSAADLMKLAMIRVHRALKRSFPSARLLLQVHDELLLECDRSEVDAVSARVREEMASCLELRVPLEVSMGAGATWFDVH